MVEFKSPFNLDGDWSRYALPSWREFEERVLGRKMLNIARWGKVLWVKLEGNRGWRIHLKSTGWFLPGNDLAVHLSVVNDIKDHFLHSVAPNTARVQLTLSDAQVWLYHDSRTWGRWEVVDGDHLMHDKYFRDYGPDWLLNPGEAMVALKRFRSGRTAKKVLTDQRVTAGIGNYLACEALWLACVHPHKPWDRIPGEVRTNLVQAVTFVVTRAMEANDHAHWMVFQKDDQPCHRCQTPIAYVKDEGGDRGSYFCPKCQPL